MDSILEVNGLVKRYPAFFLDNISFSLPRDVSSALLEPTARGKLRQYALFSTLHTKTPGQ